MKNLAMPYFEWPCVRGRWCTGISATRKPFAAASTGRKRCMSSANRISRATLLENALSPQLWSCNLRPVSQPTSTLNTREGSVLCQGSSRGVFHPLTRSTPAPLPLLLAAVACSFVEVSGISGVASIASIFGISAGSSWPSPSSITIHGARQRWNPTVSAADFPRPLGCRIPCTRASSWAAWEISCQESSVEPSSTTKSSQLWPAVSSVRRISATSGPMLPASLRTGTTSETSGTFMQHRFSGRWVERGREAGPSKKTNAGRVVTEYSHSRRIATIDS